MPSLLTQPIHLGLGATALVQPDFTGMEWYAAYAERNAGDGIEGRLVTMYTFTQDWDVWEMHPKGAEVVICVAGTMTIHQEMADGSKATVALAAGDYAINPPGAWHTADVAVSATAVFVTAGWVTEHKPR
jgi:mannose-6-phosphate isomerase-like protein (cupin superfamily)